MLPLDNMADQNVPRYQHINVSDFVNFFLKSGVFIMEGEDVHFVTGKVMSLWLS